MIHVNFEIFVKLLFVAEDDSLNSEVCDFRLGAINIKKENQVSLKEESVIYYARSDDSDDDSTVLSFPSSGEEIFQSSEDESF